MYAFLRSVLQYPEDATLAKERLRTLQKCFYSDTVQYSEGKVWDHSQLRMIGIDDIQMDGLIRGDGGFDEWLDGPTLPPEFADRIQLDTLPTEEQAHIEDLLHNQDVDSIATMRTTGTTKHTPLETNTRPGNISYKDSAESTSSLTSLCRKYFQGVYSYHGDY